MMQQRTNETIVISLDGEVVAGKVCAASWRHPPRMECYSKYVFNLMNSNISDGTSHVSTL